MEIEISKTLEKDIISFIRLNNIEDINNFLAICLRNGFNIMKYGTSPQDNFESENKPLNIKKYDTEKSYLEGHEDKETKGKRRTSKRAGETKEEQKEEDIKPKKKITIIKK